VKVLQYRKKSVVISAMQYTGENWEEALAWVKRQGGNAAGAHRQITIITLEGNMKADPGDWIIQGIAGEFYLCKPGIFDETYEPYDGKKTLSKPLAQWFPDLNSFEVDQIRQLIRGAAERDAQLDGKTPVRTVTLTIGSLHD